MSYQPSFSDRFWESKWNPLRYIGMGIGLYILWRAWWDEL